jgi:hypothetical protein
MWLLLDDEVQSGNAVDTLLSLLILGERVFFEQIIDSSFSNHADQRNELWIGLVCGGML